MQQFRPGEPCKHPGCLSHISHPCEGCGRVGGGLILDDPISDPLTEEQVKQLADWYVSLEERLRVKLSFTSTGWIEEDILFPEKKSFDRR